MPRLHARRSSSPRRLKQLVRPAGDPGRPFLGRSVRDRLCASVSRAHRGSRSALRRDPSVGGRSWLVQQSCVVARHRPAVLAHLVYPLGFFLIDRVSRTVFEPQAVPPDYVRRAAIPLVLRPKTFFANARDLALLEKFIAAQVPRYVDLRSPTIIITGDCDTMVSPEINACALAATLPRAKLVFLKGVGHMPIMPRPRKWWQQSMNSRRRIGGAGLDRSIPASARKSAGACAHSGLIPAAATTLPHFS